MNQSNQQIKPSQTTVYNKNVFMNKYKQIFNQYNTYRIKSWLAGQLPQIGEIGAESISERWDGIEDGGPEKERERDRDTQGYSTNVSAGNHNDLGKEKQQKQKNSNPQGNSRKKTRKQISVVQQPMSNSPKAPQIARNKPLQTHLINMFPCEQNRFQLITRIAIYMLEILTMAVILVIGGLQIQPVFCVGACYVTKEREELAEKGYGDASNSINKVVIGFVLLYRIVGSLFYCLLPKFRNTLGYLYLLNKLTQLVSIILFRIPFIILPRYQLTFTKQRQALTEQLSHLPTLLALTSAIQYLTDLIYIMCREQRSGYFDSRLFYKAHILRVSVLWVFQIFYSTINGTSLGQLADIANEKIIVFLLAIGCIGLIIYCIWTDTLYLLATRNLLAVLWALLFVNYLYFLIYNLYEFNQGSLKDNYRKYKSQQGRQLLMHYSVIGIINIMLLGFIWSKKHLIITCSHSIVLSLSPKTPRDPSYQTYPRPFSLSLSFSIHNSFSILSENFNAIETKEQMLQYMWAGVRMISIGPSYYQFMENTIVEVNDALGRYCEDRMCHSKGVGTLGGIGSGVSKYVYTNRLKQLKQKLFVDFHSRLTHHIYTLMLHTFKQHPQIKYLLIFFFNSRSAQKMMLYLNRQCFYDIRQCARIQQEHRSSDLAAKINQMENNEILVNGLVKDYLKKLKKLVDVVCDSSGGISLPRCKQLGQQIIDYQQQMLQFGNTQPSTLPQQQSPRIISQYTHNLLNLIRKQLLSMPELPRNSTRLSQDQRIISQIMNQEDSLILVSAERESIGKIVAINPAASRLTCYLEQELVGQNMGILLQEDMRAVHAKILNNNGILQRNTDKDYVMKNVVYLVKKNRYCSLCRLSVRFIDGTVGRRWLAKLEQMQNFTPFIVIDGQCNMIGFNQAANRIGICFNWMGVRFKDEFLDKFEQNDYADKQDYSVGVMMGHTKAYDKPKSIVLTFSQLVEYTDYEQKILQRSKREIKTNIAPTSSQKPQPPKQTTQTKHSAANRSSIDILSPSNNTKSTPIPNIQTFLQQQLKNNTILECSLICKVTSLHNMDFMGFYIIRILDFSQRIPKVLIKESTLRSQDRSLHDTQSISNTLEQPNFGKLASQLKPFRSSQSKNSQIINKHIKSFRVSSNLTDCPQVEIPGYRFSYSKNLACLTGQLPKFQMAQSQEMSQRSYCEPGEEGGAFGVESVGTHQDQRIEGEQEFIQDKQYQSYDKQINSYTSQMQSNPNRPRSPIIKKSPPKPSSNTTAVKKTRAKKSLTWQYEDINELIYINGQLEFRENKRLEEKFQCETHPLHLNHHNQYTEEEMKARQIENKDKIYELLRTGRPRDVGKKSKQDEGVSQYKYQKEHRILIGVLVLFILLLIGLNVSQISLLTSYAQIRSRKLLSTLTLSTKLDIYNRLSAGLSQYMLINLNRYIATPSYNSNSTSNDCNYCDMSSWYVEDILGQPEEWFRSMKTIQEMNGRLIEIDGRFGDWMDGQIGGVDVAHVINSIFIDFQELQILYKDLQNKKIELVQYVVRPTNESKNPSPYPTSLLTLPPPLPYKIHKILTQILTKLLPTTLSVQQHSSSIYVSQLQSQSKNLGLIVLSFSLICLAILALVVCQINLIKRKYDLNMEIFSFFAVEYLRDFATKLGSLEKKLGDDGDLMSQVGFQEYTNDEKQAHNNSKLIVSPKSPRSPNSIFYPSQADLEPDYSSPSNLLFHKKKINRTATHDLTYVIALVAIVFLSCVGAISWFYLSVLDQLIKFEVLDNWEALNQGRVLEYGYRWNLKVMRESIMRFPQIQKLYNSSIFLEFPQTGIPTLSPVVPPNTVPNTLPPLQFIQPNITTLLDREKYISRFMKHIQYINSGYLSDYFISTVRDQIDSNFCDIDYYYIKGNSTDDGSFQEKVVCDGGIDGVRIYDLEAYLQMKQYSYMILLETSLAQANPQMFQTATKFFDNHSSRLNDAALLQKSHQLLLFQLQYLKNSLSASLYIGISILSILILIACLVFIYLLALSRNFIIRPIVILVRCFPLVVLNRNQSFLDWYHKGRIQSFR